MTVISQLTTLFNYVSLSTKVSISLWLQQGTSLALFSFFILVSSVQYFGEPIQCVQDQKEDDAAINERVMNSFCFISSTYTVVKDSLGYGCDNTGKYYAIPGIGPNPTDDKDSRKHSYYIWIPFILFFQALTFLLPYSYWTYCENGLIDRLIIGVSGLDVSLSADQSNKKIREIASYFHKRLKTYKFITFAWIFRDFLSFIIVIGNFLLTDSLLGGWSTKILGFNRDSRNCWNTIEDAFPKITKCNFYKFGAGGGLQNFDSLCVMALNVINEKVYVILSFWFLILLPVTFSSLLLKIGTLICLKCLTKHSLKGLLQIHWIQLMTGIPTFTSSTALALFVDIFEPSDWVFFSQLISRFSFAISKKFIFSLREFIQDEITFVRDSTV